jgi:hypothetical protein
MFRNNLNGLAWVHHPKALMPVLTSSNIYFGGGKKKGELELHKKSKLLDGPYNS